MTGRRAHQSLSKPRKRSQSVTVLSIAVELDPGAVQVVVDHLLAEGLARDRALSEPVARRVHVGRHVGLVGRVGVAVQRWLERELGIDAVQPGGDHRRERQVRVDVGAGEPVLDAQPLAVADHAHRAGAVVVAPGDRRRRERAGGEALVGVDVRRVEEGQLLHAGELAGDEAVEELAVGREGAGAVGLRQRAVDVARAALGLIELRHEGDRHVLLGSDLLRPVLVDHVVVGGRERLRVAEVDLVLAEVALALRVLDRHPGCRHLVADPPDQRLDPRRAEQRVIDVVEVGRLEVAIRLLPGVLVGVLEHDELQLGAGVRDHPPLGEPV